MAPPTCPSPPARGRSRSWVDGVLVLGSVLMGCAHALTFRALRNLQYFRHDDPVQWLLQLASFVPFAMWLVSVYATGDWLLRGVTSKGRVRWAVSLWIAFAGFPIYLIGGMGSAVPFDPTTAPPVKTEPEKVPIAPPKSGP